jgi:hypothetical protein
MTLVMPSRHIHCRRGAVLKRVATSAHSALGRNPPINSPHNDKLK